MPGIGIAISPHFQQKQYWATREPADVVAIITGSTTATVTWTDSAVEGADGYKVYAGTTLKATVDVGVQTAAVTGLTADTEYIFKVVAYKGVSESTGDTDTKTTFLAVSQSYFDRVEADSGVVLNKNEFDDDLRAINAIDEDAALVMLMTGQGGVKYANNSGWIGVSKFYDYKGNDAINTDEDQKPSLSIYSNIINQLGFSIDGGATEYRNLTHSSILSSNYTAIYLINRGTRTIPSDVEYFHTGAINTNKLGFFLNSNASKLGFGAYNNSTVRCADEYPTLEGENLLTFTPAKLFKNGVEVVYDASSADTAGGGLTMIGARQDKTNLSFRGTIGIAIIFNKVLDTAKREAIESHFKTKYVDTYPLEPTDYEQLDYHILHTRGNQIFGWRQADDKLLYSSNSGGTFTELDFANVENIKMGFIFANGTLFFCSNNKVYRSTNNLVSISEITPKDESGNNYSVPGTGNLHFSPVHRIDSQTFDNGDEIICWGNYTLWAEPKVIWKSLNGEDCVMTYRFGTGYPHTVKHIHSVAFNSSDNKWYACTGDVASTHEVWWLSGEFANGADVGTWTDIFEGTDANQSKAMGITFADGDVYFLSDQTNGTNFQGIYHSTIANLATVANHVRDLKYHAESASMIIEDDRILFTLIDNRDDKWSLYVFDRNNYTTKRYCIIATPSFDLADKYTRTPFLRRGYGSNYLMEIWELDTGYVNNTVRFTI